MGCKREKLKELAGAISSSQRCIKRSQQAHGKGDKAGIEKRLKRLGEEMQIEREEGHLQEAENAIDERRRSRGGERSWRELGACPEVVWRDGDNQQTVIGWLRAGTRPVGNVFQLYVG
jgi:hypothetical protein